MVACIRTGYLPSCMPTTGGYLVTDYGVKQLW